MNAPVALVLPSGVLEVTCAGEDCGTRILVGPGRAAPMICSQCERGGHP